MLAFSIRALCALTLAMGCTWLGCSRDAREVDVRNVSASETQELQNAASPPLLLDVRTEAEFRAGHIAGAIHIPHTELAARLGEIRVPEAGVIVYCQKGPRARMAEQTLVQQGISRVMHLEDGFSGWEAANLPVER